MNKCLSLLLLSVPAAWAVPTHVQHNVTNSGGSTAVSSWSTAYSSSNTLGNTLIVFVTGAPNSSGPSAFGVSDSQGNTWTAATSLYGLASGNNPIQIFYASNCKAGANTVTVTATGDTMFFFTAAVHEYSGLSNSSPVDVTASANSATGSVSVGPITTTVANDLLFVVAAPNTSTTSAGSGFTLRCNLSGFSTEDGPAATAGSYTGTMTTAGGWSAQIVAFKAAVTAVTKGRIWVE